MGTSWPTEDNPGIAVVAPTGFGSFGIWWSEFEAMERRGGYSGPYRTAEEAEQGALDWGKHWEAPVRVIHQAEKPE